MSDARNENRIPLAVVGCDFRTASSRWRSRLVLDAAEAEEIAHSLARLEAADGFADLNTCNRTEWIVSTEQPDWVVELLRAQMKQRVGPEADWFEPYAFVGEEAARHILRVAVGLESLVVGERQIAGQLYLALEDARERGTSSRILNGLGVVSGRLVRAADRRGCLSGAGVGVHGLSLRYLQHRLGSEEPIDVLVLGLGSIGRQVSALAEANPAIRPVYCNRTIAPERAGQVQPLSRLPELLRDVDAAVVCTGAPELVLPADKLPNRGERPLLVIDIGIPEQVARADVPEGVEVVGLDELTAFHLGRAGGDQPDASACEREVEFSLGEFLSFCSRSDYAEILDTVHKRHGHLVKEDLPAVVADLPPEERTRVTEELRKSILGYTSEVLRTIRSQKRTSSDEE